MSVNLSFIGGAGWQFFDNNGVILSGGKIYTYVAGTTTPLATYTSRTGLTANTNPIVLDAYGRTPEQVWSTEGLLYKYVVAKSNDVVLRTWDNIGGSVVASDLAANLAASSGSSLVGFLQSGTGAVATTVQTKLRESVSVKDFGAVGDGVTDDRAACQAAITTVRAAGGGVVYFPAGNYLINGVTSSDSILNGLLIPFTTPSSVSGRVKLVGAGRSTQLLAGSNGMCVIRLSDSNCAIESMSVSGNGKTTTIGIGLLPENITQTTVCVYQTYNVIRDVWVLGCSNGLRLQSGPRVSLVDSGCWYNAFSNIHFYFCTRGIWLSGATSMSASNNRNTFSSIRIGNASNTGIQIDEGDTNSFVGVAMEGINTGTSPNAVPTGIKILQTGASGSDNNSNIFISCFQESVTRSLENANSFSEFYGCVFPAAYTMVLTNSPRVLIGGDASSIPQFLPGYQFQSNGQLAGVQNNSIYAPNGKIQFPAIQLASSDPNVLDDYKEGTWTPIVSGLSSPGTCNYVSQIGRYTKIGNLVSFQVKVAYDTHTGTGTMIVSLPFTSGSITGMQPIVTIAADNLTFTGQMSGLIQPISSYITLITTTSGASAAGVAMDAAATIYASGQFFV